MTARRRAGAPSSVRIVVKVTTEERALLATAATAADKPMGAYVRDEAIRRALADLGLEEVPQ